MAKKIDKRILEIVGTEIESNSYGKFKVLEYIGKTKNKHVYKIEFVETGYTTEVNRDSILRKSCVDKDKQTQNKKERAKKEFQRRKKMNQIKGSSKIFWNKKHCRILSIDQATNESGISYFIDEQLISYENFKTKQDDSYIQKILQLEEHIEKIIKKLDIDVLILEGVYLEKNLDVYKKLVLTQGQLLILAYKLGIRVYVCPAHEWKEGIGISKYKGRNAQKGASIKLIESLYGINLKGDDNISDSICMGIHASKNVIIRNDNSFSWNKKIES